MGQFLLSKNKRGTGDDTLFETVIFIVLNLIFFIALLFFILNSKNAVILYEQLYSKQISLLLDEAKPGTEFYISLDDGLTRSKKIGYIKEASLENGNLDKILKINKEDNSVSVSLGSGSSYTSYYYTNNDFEYKTGGSGLKIIKNVK